MWTDPAFMNRMDWHCIEIVEPFASLAKRHDQVSLLQDPEVLHDRTPIKLLKAGTQLLGCERPQRKLIANFAADRVGKRFENQIEVN